MSFVSTQPGQAQGGSAPSSPVSTRSFPETPSERVSRKRGAYFNNKTLSDVKIKIGDQEFFAHKFVLVEQSVWFEKALLGEFKESKQDVIDLGNDDDPAALAAMLRFCYDGTYPCCPSDTSPTDYHMATYRLADLYDIVDLRREASDRLITSLQATQAIDGIFKMTDETVASIQQILGSDADSFADKAIQEDFFEYVVRRSRLLYQNSSFRALLADGCMFNEHFGYRFAGIVAQIMANPAVGKTTTLLHSRS